MAVSSRGTRAGAVNPLVLPPMPKTINAQTLEAWRQQAQTLLDQAITALKLDRLQQQAGGIDIAALLARIAALETAVAGKVNRAGDTMTGALFYNGVVQSNNEYVTLGFAKALSGGGGVLYGHGDPNGRVTGFKGQLYQDVDSLLTYRNSDGAKTWV